jgi:hypothetical protein
VRFSDVRYIEVVTSHPAGNAEAAQGLVHPTRLLVKQRSCREERCPGSRNLLLVVDSLVKAPPDRDIKEP